MLNSSWQKKSFVVATENFFVYLILCVLCVKLWVHTKDTKR